MFVVLKSTNKIMKLQTKTDYIFSKEDLDFVLELAKVGGVNLLSSQVRLISEKEGFSFKEYHNDGGGCDGLKIPENWVIEFIGRKGENTAITFGVKKNS